MAHDDPQLFLRPQPDSPPAVGNFARAVVSALNNRQSTLQKTSVRVYLAEIILHRVIAKASFDAKAVLAELRGYRLGDQAIIDAYIPAIACEIGEMWVQDRLSFADVTIASVRLQSLLTEVAYCNPERPRHVETAFHAMVVICEGDQHSLGGFVAAAQLRRMGASVEVTCNVPAAQVAEQVIAGVFDAVLFSCSRRRSLATVADIVHMVRTGVRPPPIFALGGIILNHVEDIEATTGVDIVASDVASVVEHCMARMSPVPGVASR